MFNRFKSLFSGGNGRTKESLISQKLVSTQPVGGPARSRLPKTREVEAPKAPVKPAAPSSTSNVNDGEVSVLLISVLNALPPDLKARVAQFDVRAATLTISLQRALSQLAQGAVTISFGDLRQAAPQLFSPGDDCDQREVALPLDDILAQIPKTALDAYQKQKAAKAPVPIPGTSGEAKNSANRAIPSTGNVSAPAPAPASVPSEPQSRGPIRVPVKTAAAKPTPEPSLTPVAGPPPSPAKPLAKSVDPKVDRPVASSPANSVTERAATPPTPPAKDSFMTVSLQALCQAWPAAVRSELGQTDLAKAEVNMPTDVVQTAMKRGRVAFPWKTIRPWIVPAVPSTNSANDYEVLELPLAAVMPAFLKTQKAAVPQQKIAVDDNVPPLFAPPQRTEATTNPIVQNNGSSNGNSSDSSALKHSHANNGALAVVKEAETGVSPNIFKQKVPQQHQTPSEIVSRAAALNGVAGALVALPDGFMVASKLPKGTDGDVLAALLPYIFAKVNDCIKEIRIGELNSLDFVASNVPWKIFLANNVFLAAFGFTGEALPGQQLVALARELHYEEY